MDDTLMILLMIDGSNPTPSGMQSTSTYIDPQHGAYMDHPWSSRQGEGLTSKKSMAVDLATWHPQASPSNRPICMGFSKENKPHKVISDFLKANVPDVKPTPRPLSVI